MTKEQKFFLLVVLIVAGASVTYYYKSTDVVPTSAVGATTTSFASSSGTTPTPLADIPAHSFSSEITYPTPEDGKEKIYVTISLKAGIIDDVTFTYDTPLKTEAKNYISNFEKALPSLTLKGKKLTEVSLSRVGGASLTTDAFMEAVGKINAQASNG